MAAERHLPLVLLCHGGTGHSEPLSRRALDAEQPCRFEELEQRVGVA
jgi:hypothetical protein